MLMFFLFSTLIALLNLDLKVLARCCTQYAQNANGHHAHQLISSSPLARRDSYSKADGASRPLGAFPGGSDCETGR